MPPLSQNGCSLGPNRGRGFRSSAASSVSVGDVVVYESTVFPGATEEVCVPILERVSGLKFNTDFFCGYSPERINPGDREHSIVNIKKVTSGSTPEVAELVDSLYNEIITAGTHKAASSVLCILFGGGVMGLAFLGKA